jgi:hypothetical protein
MAPLGDFPAGWVREEEALLVPVRRRADALRRATGGSDAWAGVLLAARAGAWRRALRDGDAGRWVGRAQGVPVQDESMLPARMPEGQRAESREAEWGPCTPDADQSAGQSCADAAQSVAARPET